MAKSERQKLKLLYIAKILREETDEEHPISTPDLIARLRNYDIKAERKSIYSDIEHLRQFGMDIEFNSSRKGGGYYLSSRDFELAELKILVDMVQASRFLTKKKSRELIGKIEAMAGLVAAKELQRSVFVAGRTKAENETVYYNVDRIHKAIRDNKGILFQYYEYSVGKEFQLKKAGEKYHVSPYYLTWNNENYYLVGVDEKLNAIRHYRVDRMKQIDIAKTMRVGKDLFEDFDIADYTNATYGMFGGEKKNLRICFQNDLAGVVIDRFGKDISLRKQDDNTFTIQVAIVPSNQFFGWMAGLGTRATILGPQDVKEEYHDYIGRIYKNYP